MNLKTYLKPVNRSYLFALIAFLSACSSAADEDTVEVAAEQFGTTGPKSRYHLLAARPYIAPLNQQGYIVAIEKARRDRIGVGFKGHDTKRLNFQDKSYQSPKDYANQKGTFNKVMDDPKIMFVSHILRYAPTDGDAGMRTILQYSAYTADEGGDPPSSTYENGWDRLARLEGSLEKDIVAAKQSGHPFTHLVFMSMGWNNDQVESMAAYNEILSQLKDSADAADNLKFNPLVVGLTWPSVWGGTSAFDLGNRALHIGSYGVKADDSDEIGYSYANYLMNYVLPRLERKHPELRTIAIGHSLGARIVTRAHYSQRMLNEHVEHPSRPVIIGLQGAFSSRRFIAGTELPPVVDWIFVGEGAPYQKRDDPPVMIALTWSEEDHANPVARFATGAAHVGGKNGANVLEKSQVTLPSKADERGRIALNCGDFNVTDKLLYVDATEIVSNHGDVKNPAVGSLIWQILGCL
ncbi:hypothetical protein [Poseidonocella sp. HB161398]|uniref:hypothetical protein n=1 Tax=Poseidonocella sp. HB161398 TaxID=2320855 RepID=UPI001108A3D9|nr:hypothetical protein [Poseidonocella sp. HB161398]